MKRKLLFACSLFLISWGVNSCEILNDCKNCRQVTYIDEVYDHEGDTYQYCGAQLITVETTKDIVNGSIRTAWECK